MPWRRFGAPIAVIVLLFALGRISSIVVDWAWFSSIGYLGVFWTVFATKAALFASSLPSRPCFSGRTQAWRIGLRQGRA